MNPEELTAPLAGHAAQMLSRAAGAEAELVSRCVGALFAALAGGGVCVPLADFGDAADVEARLLALPVAGRAGRMRPLVVENGLLYFQRYHALESALAARLLTLARTPAKVPAGAEEPLSRLLSRALCVVTGGPGTGKTFLAGQILRLLAADRPGGVLSAVLAAPTGRASARLAESVRAGLKDAANVALSHGTVHRVLGAGRDGTSFRRNAARPIPADVVVLDESSMMDVPLMARFLDAVDPASTRLVLLGDPGQLPSIYSGSVLSDIAEAAANPSSPLAPCLATLTLNRRSGEVPQLAALVEVVRRGDAEGALGLLEGGGPLSLIPPPGRNAIAAFAGDAAGPLAARLRAARSPEEALEAVSSRRLVCMLRQGPLGADALNAAALEAAAPSGARFFHGLPLVVTRNDPSTGLCNGDTGVVLRQGGGLRAWFAGAEGPRGFAPAALPPAEPAYAITVHRAQGSEYGDVTLVLPERDHPMLTRELFYTGISRARESLTVATAPALVRAALARRCRRAGGLSARLV